MAGTTRQNLSQITKTLTLSTMLKRIAMHTVFKNITEIGGVMWFLEILFIISICYCVADYLIKRFIHKNTMVPQFILSVVLLGVGYFCARRSVEAHGLARAASCYILFFMGRFLREKEICEGKSVRRNLLTCVLSFAVLLLAYFLCAARSSGDDLFLTLRLNRYQDPLYLIVCSLAGWMFLYSAAFFLLRTPLKRPLLAIGKRTMGILIFQYFGFKAVTEIIILLKDLPSYCLAAHPHFHGEEGCRWLAYAVAGVGIPFLMNLAYEKIRDAVKAKLPAKNGIGK